MSGPLRNLNHENFCCALHKRLLAKERRSKALAEAYRETMLDVEGERSDKQIGPNARRLANRPEVLARLAELGEFTAKISGIDSAWGIYQAKKLYEANIADYLTASDANGKRLLRLDVPDEKLSVVGEVSITDKGVRIKLPDKVAVLTWLARVNNWFAPDTLAPAAWPSAPIEIRLIKPEGE